MIILIRHGKPVCKRGGWMTREQLINWLKAYDEAIVYDEPLSYAEAKEKIKCASVVLVSSLARARHSASLLQPSHLIKEHGWLVEAPLPKPPKWMKGIYPLWMWLAFLRLLWFCGYGEEPYAKTKQRAIKAAKQLNDYAQKGSVVAVIGHGWFHMLVSQQLKQYGWQTKKKKWAYWEAVTLSLTRRTP
ncbi:broad specificity phosphatase PhoE [Anoxybacillus mongoliensis]|uniref:Broad specificity phosphatase PhoE n=1 Tax=Anoxybacillus mongoliensis TaxID=452565 RepID=A0A7W8JEN8_9BACL|nr:phosphoglycerate mutase family protein [Anoxybacillus mongoliensis]MBB5355343.1 broad specificity phosphatase PhoE [Anoxybacillus mongoliensis]